MLEKPDIPDESIIACLQDAYGLPITRVDFLPIGVDQHAAVYCAAAQDETPYFVKLRKGDFNEVIVLLSKFLSDLGIEEVIAPLETKTGQLWAHFDLYRLVLYPFIEGLDGYQTRLQGRHWQTLGRAIKSVHTAVIPPELHPNILQENYSPIWREMVRVFLGRIKKDFFVDPVAVELSIFLAAKSEQICDLVDRAEWLASLLAQQPRPFVLCHADLHAGNLLVDNTGLLHIVDWDEPVFAPKERDLMYVGGGLGGNGCTAEEEKIFFYAGYGQTQVDPTALLYYRYERIIQDIALFSEEIFSSKEGGEDREQAFRYLKSNFLPNGVLDIAYNTEERRLPGVRYG
jgi:spectinomycin phosphotransferase